MAKPQSILGNVKGMARDFSIDSLPKGYVWDLADYLPQQRGAQLEGRAPWTFLSDVSMAGAIDGGCDAVYSKGEKLLVAAGGFVYDQPRSASMQGATHATQIAPLFSSVLHNGRFWYDRVYWADSAGQAVPKYVTYDGNTVTVGQFTAANVPKAKLVDVWKGRLIAAGDPLHPEWVYWAPVAAKIGDAWDATAYLGMDRAVTAIGPMANVCIVFHDGMTSRIKGGTIPPGGGLTQRDGMDTTKETFSDQYGCVDPRSVVPWQENLIFANSHGVMLTDGSTIRSLSDQGGIGEAWRHLYGLKRTGTQVSCGIYLNKLFCSILTTWTTGTEREDRSFVFVCDLATRNWYRLTNILATTFIPSTTGAEQLWFGTDNQPTIGTAFWYRLARISPMYSGLVDYDEEFHTGPTAAAVDPNGVPILPRITTGFNLLGPEGQKRMRHIYVSHETQKADPPNNVGNVLRVGYRVNPVVLDTFIEAGQLPVTQNGIPYSNLYDRKRLPVGRQAYGIQVHLEQVLPSHISRLYDIGIEHWPIDRGRVS